MSRSGTPQMVSAVVNFVVVGAATLFLGFLLMESQEKQKDLEAKIDANEANVKKMFNAYSGQSARYKEVASAIADLNRDLNTLRSSQDARTQDTANTKAMIVAEVQVARQEIEKQVAEEVAILESMMNSQTGPAVQSVTSSNASPATNAIPLIANDAAHRSIRNLTLKPFTELFAFPPDRSAQQAILVTNHGEVFFLDKKSETLETVWDKHRERFSAFVSDHIRSEFRRDKKAFSKMVLDHVPDKTIQQLKARDLSNSTEVLVDFPNQQPRYIPGGMSIGVVLRAGNATEEYRPSIPYHAIPGLIEIPKK